MSKSLLGAILVTGCLGGVLASSRPLLAQEAGTFIVGCSRDQSRDPACVAAIHRFCSADGRGGAGLAQDVGPAATATTFGISCFQPSWAGDVPIAQLKQLNPGCDDPGKSQSPACMAAVHRWCATGKGGAGLAQEIGNGVFSVACFRTTHYQDVPVAQLKTLSSGCDDIGKSQRQDCVAAIHRWCINNGKGTGGLSQEVGDGVLGVACFAGTTHSDVPVSAGAPAH